MFRIIDTFKIGDKLSVTLEGKCEEIKNGTHLTDSKGNLYEVVSVGMTRHDNPTDIVKNTTVLITPNNLELEKSLYIA